MRLSTNELRVRASAPEEASDDFEGLKDNDKPGYLLLSVRRRSR
jgi:hypothetical protein